MNHMDQYTADRYRFGFKRFNPFMIWLWRLGFRRWVNCLRLDPAGASW